jgi:hypothetical protein
MGRSKDIREAGLATDEGESAGHSESLP